MKSKICPLFFAALLAYEGLRAVSMPLDSICLEKECMWWDQIEQDCEIGRLRSTIERSLIK